MSSPSGCATCTPEAPIGTCARNPPACRCCRCGSNAPNISGSSGPGLMNVSGSGLNSIGPPDFNSTPNSLIRTPNLDCTGGSGISRISAPSFNSSCSRASSNAPCPQPNSPVSGPSRCSPQNDSFLCSECLRILGSSWHSSGGSGLSRVGPPDFNSTFSSIRTPTMDYSGVSGISGISAPSFNSSCSRPASNGPCPHHQSPRGPSSPVAGPSGTCNYNTPPRLDCSGLGNLSDISGSGLSSLGPPNFCSTFSSVGTPSLDCSRVSGISGINAPSFNSSCSRPSSNGPCSRPTTPVPCNNNNAPVCPSCSPGPNLNISGGSGLSNVGPPDFNSTMSSIRTPNLDCSGSTAISGISPPSFNSSCSRSSCPTPSLNYSGVSGISGINAPSFNSSCSRSSCPTPSLNYSGVSGISGINAPSFNSSCSQASCPTPSLNYSGASGISGIGAPSFNSSCSQASCPTPSLNYSGVSGISGINAPSFNSSCSQASCPTPSLNYSGVSGISGIGAPSFNSSCSQASCPTPSLNYSGASGISGIGAPSFNSSCSQPGSNGPCPVAGSSGACNNSTPARPDCSGLGNLSDISGSGLSSLGPPNYYGSFSSAGTPDLDCSRQSGLSGVFMPSFNSTFLSDLNSSSPDQPFTSTPCRNGGSPNFMEFSPYQTPPNLMQFSSDSSGQGYPSGNITRNAELAFGDSSFSNGSCDRGIGIRRLTSLNQSPQVPRTEDSMMEQMVNDARQFLRNMSNASSNSSSSCPSGRRSFGTPSTVPATPLALPQIGSPFLWSPNNTSIGNSTLEDLRWGSYEENILNSSNTSGAYDMELAAQLPFANSSPNSTGPYDHPSSRGGSNCRRVSFSHDGTTYSGGAVAMCGQDPSMSGCSKSGQDSSCSRSSMPKSCNRVFDINRLKIWVMKTVANTCQGQCGKSPLECEEQTLKYLLGLVTSWRNLYSQGRDGMFNFLNSNHALRNSCNSNHALSNSCNSNLSSLSSDSSSSCNRQCGK